ncbi:MAG: PrsW family glutamic-type intramembrane protease [Acetatifactor sp.]|nr:PrsW family glutamic-type intramembrane protease [Acetatifactor sp.]
MSIIALLLLALVPPALLLAITYGIDRQEKEPMGLLLLLLLLGAVSCIPAAIVELVGQLILELLALLPIPRLVIIFIMAVLVVAVAEEGFKYLFLRLMTWKKSSFNYRFDGIVYAVYTSLGFAAAENLLYVLQNGAGTGWLRAFTSVPMHASCGVLMGIFYGRAKGCANVNNKKGYKQAIRKTLLYPILAHGWYDFCLMTESGWMVLLWVLTTIALFVYIIVNLVQGSKQDHSIAPKPAPVDETRPDDFSGDVL